MEPFDPYQGDPVLRAVVERALQPYSTLPAEEVRRLRDFLIVHATTHPAIAPLYEQLRSRPEVQQSGPQAVAPVEPTETAPAPSSIRARAANDD